MTEEKILDLLNLEMQRAKLRGEMMRLEKEDEALSNAIWRKTQFLRRPQKLT